MEILILICAVGVAAPACQHEVAIHSFTVPGHRADLGNCLRGGMIYAADSGLVVEGTYPKVSCIPEGRSWPAIAKVRDGR